MSFKLPRGTRDILPADMSIWYYLESKLHAVSRRYGYREIRTPIFEHTEVFSRSVGEDTDIVAKEMYSFRDRGDRHITLRPEGTAAITRAYLEHRFDAQPPPVKFYYYGPMFRYDRPQQGRYRQFYQFGIECFGVDHPAADAEVIALTTDFLEEIGLEDVELQINSVGCSQCRSIYRQKLVDYLAPHREQLCNYCHQRFDSNPLRMLDCKKVECQEIFQYAPEITTVICEECHKHFSDVQRHLQNLNIEYEINTRLVRGLDYYTRTAFEFISSALGAQNSIGGGGRYDNLVEFFGGKQTPAVGMAMGMERIILSLHEQKQFPPHDNLQVLISAEGEKLLFKAMELAGKLRKYDITAEVDYTGRSLKSLMKYADKHNYSYVLIWGEWEQKKDKITVRNMQAGDQEELSEQQVVELMKRTTCMQREDK